MTGSGIAIVIGMAITSFFNQAFWERYYERKDRKKKAKIFARLLQRK